MAWPGYGCSHCKALVHGAGPHDALRKTGTERRGVGQRIVEVTSFTCEHCRLRWQRWGEDWAKL